ncbi:MAG TPA: hypothetical protein VNJ08_15365 [Bacteriovoracaceae bacterium]|nr:hypothetical protein [Bacteriovoracaceae bacterium]
MSPKSQILIEGTYLYYQNDVNYCQEDFKVVQIIDNPVYYIHSEISSRVDSGEFLKIMVQYAMTNHFIPFFVQIEKSIGSQYAVETFKFDQHAQELQYVFKNSQITQEFKRNHSSKHYLTAPGFATAAMFTLSRKMDPTGRSAVTVVSSQNEWTYVGPPLEKIIYAEIKNREMDDYKLNNTTLPAAHLRLYDSDSSHASSGEIPTDLYLSKHFAIPYQMVQGNSKINIKNLKKHN